MKTILKIPTETQLENIASHIKDKLLLNWDVADIASGIKRVRVNAGGFVSEVYVAPGLFARLCYYEYGGHRTRKPFALNGFLIKQWKERR